MAVQSLFRGLPDTKLTSSPDYEMLVAFDADLRYLTRAIYCASAGNLSVRRPAPDNTVVTIPVVAGTTLAIEADRIIAATTTVPQAQIFIMY